MKHYSRRELYALGETLGESATRIEGGRRIYGGGGGMLTNAVSSAGNAMQQTAAPSTPSVSATPQANPVSQPSGPAPFSQATSTVSNPAPSQSPMSQVDTQQGVAQYAMPYVESMLGATQNQLFNYDQYGNMTGMKGYTPYSYNPGDYFAGFTPLQQQAQAGVAGLSLPSSFGQAMGLTGQTYGNLMGLGGQAARAGQNYARQATNPYAVQSYMNPYLQASLAPQMDLLSQQQARQGQQLASQASQAGAFGGSRFGIEQGLQNQANQLAMSNLVGQGYNNAYNQAMQNMQYGANLGLQGQQAAAGMYGQGLGAANQLANVGNQALQAQQGILGLQQSTGATQQGLQQQMINQAVQNYNTAQQYPYQQLGFMQNMLQGLPLTTTSQQTYQQAPSMMQNLAALGMGMYGMNSLLGGGSGTGATGTSGGGVTGALNTVGKLGTSVLGGIGDAVSGAGSWINQNLLGGLFAEGGEVKGYAAGGSVDSPENVDNIISKLSDSQLQQAMQFAMARNDMERMQALKEEMSTRASERGGLAGLYNQLPQQAQQQMMAGGGVIAFANRGAVEDDSDDADTQEEQAQAQAQPPSPGNPVAYAQLGPMAIAAAKRLQEMPDFVSATPQQRAAMEQQYMDKLMTQAGPSPYGGLRDYIKQAETDRGSSLEQGKGLAALSAMSGMLKPGGFMRGLGEAGGAFAGQYGQALAADRAEKRSLAQMQFNLADAERKERMGLHRDAEAAVARAEQNRLDAHKAKITKETNAASTLARTAQAMKPTGAGARPPAPKDIQVGASLYLPAVQADPAWKAKPLPEQMAEAARRYRTDPTAISAGVRSAADASKAFTNMSTLRGTEWRKLVKENYGGDEAAAKRDFLEDYKNGTLPAHLQRLLESQSRVPSTSAQPTNPNVIKLD